MCVCHVHGTIKKIVHVNYFLTYYLLGVDKWILSMLNAALRWLLLIQSVVAPSGERLRGEDTYGIFVMYKLWFIIAYLSASNVSFSQWCAIEIYLPFFPSFLYLLTYLFTYLVCWHTFSFSLLSNFAVPWKLLQEYVDRSMSLTSRCITYWCCFVPFRTTISLSSPCRPCRAGRTHEREFIQLSPVVMIHSADDAA